MRGRLAGAVAALVVLLAPAAPLPARAEEPVDLSWTELLPPVGSPPGGTGGPQPGCKKATIRCVDRVVRRLRRARDRYGCDHRAVFATTYLELTKVIRRTLREEPRFFADRRALIYEDVLFARYYFDALADREAGRRVAPAWEVAFDAAASGDQQGVGDMLLGINAHVQNDMPFVLAGITLRDAKGRSRKGDHDRGNEVLNRAFEQVTREVARRYDPLAAWETYKLSPVTDVFGIEMVRTWREGVWRNAERLVNARNEAERAQVAQSIETQAALTAGAIRATTLGPPGYRAERDAYCAGATDTR